MDFFTLTMPLHESVLRASFVYLALCLLLRIMPKRQIGQIAPQDIVIAIVIGDLAVGGIIPNGGSPLEVIILIATVLGWDYLLDWLADRYPRIRKLIREGSTVLIRNGRLQKHAMHKEMITKDELLAELRKHGLETIDEVRDARLEADGVISVVKWKS